ncbi:MAG: hypothetical protein Q7R83_04480 [bacterium]|nr:hypothetical protein [bacterium]
MKRNLSALFAFVFGIIVSSTVFAQDFGFSHENGGVTDDAANASFPIETQAIPACMPKVDQLNRIMSSGTPEERAKMVKEYCGDDLRFREELTRSCNDLLWKCGEQLAQCYNDRDKWCESIKVITPPPSPKQKKAVKKTVEICNKDDVSSGRGKQVKGRCECLAGTLTINYRPVPVPRIFVKLFPVQVGTTLEKRGVCLEAMSGNAFDIAVGAAISNLDDMLKDPRFASVVAEIVKAQEEVFHRANPVVGSPWATTDFEGQLKPVNDRLAALEKRVDEIDTTVKEHSTHLEDVDQHLVDHDQKIASLQEQQKRQAQDLNGLRHSIRSSSQTIAPPPPAPPPMPPEKKGKEHRKVEHERNSAVADDARFIWGIQASGLYHFTGRGPDIYGGGIGFRPRIRIGGPLYLYIGADIALTASALVNGDMKMLPYLQFGSGLELMTKYLNIAAGVGVGTLWKYGGITIDGRHSDTFNWGGGAEVRVGVRVHRKVEIFGSFKPGYFHAWYVDAAGLKNANGFGFTSELGVGFML